MHITGRRQTFSYRPLCVITALTTIVLVLSSCSEQKPVQPIETRAQQAIQKAHTSSGQQRTHYRIEAARLLLESGQYKRADELLSELPVAERDAQTALLSAKANTLLGRYAKAQELLDNASPIDTLNQHMQLLHHRLQLNIALHTNDLPAFFEASNRLRPTLNGGHQKQLNRLTWQYLASQSKDELAQSWQDCDAYGRGWLELNLINKEELAKEHFQQSIADWQTSHPDHPANDLVKEHSVSNVTKPSTIAAMLPLQGQYQHAGQAIRQGLLAGYYQAHNHQSRPIKLQIYDTSQNKISELYDQALNDGADMIIGPLRKPNIQRLIEQRDLAVPTLSLNHINNDTGIDNLYQFGLHPETQAKQSAQRAQNQGLDRALVIVPDNHWGQRVSNAFKQQWRSKGHDINGILTFSADHTNGLSQQIASLMGVSQSKARALHLKRQMDTKFHFEPRRRQDFNTVLLGALPHEARQIKPLINYYYADRIPVYATGTVYSGTPDRAKDSDMDGICFCDIPWVTYSDKSLPTDLRQAYHVLNPLSDKTTHPKLNALGVDAFYLAEHLDLLSQYPQLPFQGATGLLQLASDNTIQVTLPCSQIRNGKLHELVPSSPLLRP